MPKYTKKKIDAILKKNKKKVKTKNKTKSKNELSNSGNIIVIDQSKKTNPRQPSQPKIQQPIYIPPTHSQPVYIPQPQQQQQPQQNNDAFKNVLDVFSKNNEAQQQAFTSLSSRVDDAFRQNSGFTDKLSELQNNYNTKTSQIENNLYGFQDAFQHSFAPALRVQFNAYGNSIDNLWEKLEEIKSNQRKPITPPLEPISDRNEPPQLGFNFEDDISKFYPQTPEPSKTPKPSTIFKDNPIFTSTTIMSQQNTDYKTPDLMKEEEPQKEIIVKKEEPQKENIEKKEKVVKKEEPQKEKEKVVKKKEPIADIEDVEEDEPKGEIVEIEGPINYVKNWDYENDIDVKTTTKEGKTVIICNICGKLYASPQACNVHIDKHHISNDGKIGTYELKKGEKKERGIFETFPVKYLAKYKRNLNDYRNEEYKTNKDNK